MSDCIVYKQEELEQAIKLGVKRITLCAGIFNIDKVHGAVFENIGPVKLKVRCSRAEAESAGMQFKGIFPEFKEVYAESTRMLMNPVAVTFGASYGSGSYLSVSSGSGSYLTSYNTSGNGSYLTSYSTSGSGSYLTSYTLSGSFKPSAAYMQEAKQPIAVYGYGIDLI